VNGDEVAALDLEGRIARAARRVERFAERHRSIDAQCATTVNPS
jgi:hypothetical protein